MPVEWTKKAPSVYNFSGTNGNGGDYTFDLTVVTGGTNFTGVLRKEGATQGSGITFESIDEVKALFAHVAANIP